MIKRFLRTDNDPAALIMRLALGLVMFAHGTQKVLGWWGGYGAAATIQGFSKMGLPPFITVLVMLAALVMVHANVGFFMNWAGTQKGEGFEYHLLALGLSIALLIKGGGALSVDRAIAGDQPRFVGTQATP